MAEWLGTGLQNLLQRFDSAWYLQKCLWSASRGICITKSWLHLGYMISPSMSAAAGSTHSVRNWAKSRCSSSPFTSTLQEPAVLTENLYQDNKEDVAFLESGEGAQAIINLHVEGIFRYLQQ